MTAEILALSDITISFGGIKALSNVSCSIERGKIVGVIGPNGAGKTTLFNVITGAYTATSGQVSFDGHSISDWPAHRIARAGVIRTFQNIRLFSSMSVWEHLLVAQPLRRSIADQFLPTQWSSADLVRHAKEVLHFFDLEAVAHQPAKSLSYGMQRKVEMARALVAAPKILLLDEPVAGMNHEEAESIRRQMLRLREDGMTILLIEHDMNFVMNLCDFIYVLDGGTMIAKGSPSEVRNNPAVLDAYLGADV
jgi:branched-chain amino acid transport system ATP-binding protein